jgi:phosphatidylethanolamine/phosphatidyl-N-methylethanolamine N-methyltransferase
MPSDLALFVKQLLRRPHEVVALAPSSAELARAMAAGVTPETGRVVEFGAGTGKITRAILDRGLPPENLTLFEMNPDFVARLRQSFPGVTVHQTGAQDVASFCPAGVDAVISGLPLLSMQNDTQRAIVGGAFAVLREGGSYTQFTYGPRPPMAEAVQRELGLMAQKGPKVWNNLPPARVYTFTRALT